MKTKIISKLKNELLLVELPENGYYGEYRDGIEVRDFLTDEVLTLADYTLLGKPDEIKESVAKELVKQIGEGQKINMFGWKNYKNEYLWCKTALESFHSALESEIYWENPIKIIPRGEASEHDRVKNQNEFNEAQEKTFDKKRTLIFVQN